MIARTILELIPQYMHKGRAIIIYGARRTGKTTILNSLAAGLKDLRYINCDLIDGQEAFNFKNSDAIRLEFGRYSHLLIDEAQRVGDIGIKLKALIDTLPELQIIATGSSSLDLSNFTSEPLTGRKFEFLVTPLSTQEIYLQEGIDAVKGGLAQRLVFGNYPEVYLEKTMPVEIIKEIAGSYLFKDLLVYQDIKRPDLLKQLLIALALQTGSEVSYTELGNTVGMDKKTVDRYIGLLEQCFVIYRLGSYSRNLRNELKRAVKIYFWDNGIRNALINRFEALDKRSDLGALWENYVITERRKLMLNRRANFDHYFWRTTAQQEIDLIETEDERIRAFELKWNPGKKPKIPSSFSQAYPSSENMVINPENYLESLL
ncbi:MAG: ATP-binding protein [Candidatus Syntrophosphaera sp.]|nr:ATP-binding protein [Candidatus Syntrophosphaera sp.]